MFDLKKVCQNCKKETVQKYKRDIVRLFKLTGSGDLPDNTNNKPYTYYIESDTNGAGWITTRMVITDLDPDSPSYEEYVIGEL